MNAGLGDTLCEAVELWPCLLLPAIIGRVGDTGMKIVR
jgi:hypothetical protein